MKKINERLSDKTFSRLLEIEKELRIPRHQVLDHLIMEYDHLEYLDKQEKKYHEKYSNPLDINKIK